MSTAALIALWLTAGVALPIDEGQAPGERRISVIIEATSESDADDENSIPVGDTNVAQGGDSDTDVRVLGKVVVVGPDGVRREINFSRLRSGNALELPKKLQILLGSGVQESGETVEDRYVIGVSAAPANALLRRHLQLSDRGLLITAVMDESSADAAGLQEGDLLLQANDHILNTVEQLVKVVRDSEGAAIRMHLLRDGEATEAILTPKLQKVTNASAPAMILHHKESPSVDILNRLLNRKFDDVLFRRIGPGLVIRKGSKLKTGDNVEESEFELKADVGASDELQRVRDEIEELRKQLAEIQGQLSDGEE